MLKETATVVSRSGNRAKVIVVRSEACGNCPAKDMCSTASGETNILEVRNPVKAEPGARVVVELEPRALVKATALIYLVPALAMVFGATVGWLGKHSDGAAMGGALAGFLTAALFLYLHGRRERSSSGPVISEVLSRSNASCTGEAGQAGRSPFRFTGIGTGEDREKTLNPGFQADTL